MAEARSSQEAGLLRALGDAERIRSRAAAAAEGFIDGLNVRELVENLADENEAETLAEELIDFLSETVGDEFGSAARLHAKSLGQRPMSKPDLIDLLDTRLAETELDLARDFRENYDRLRGRIASVEEHGAVDAVEFVLDGPAGDVLMEPFRKTARRHAMAGVAGAFDEARVATREARETAAGREERGIRWTWLTVGDSRVCDTGEIATSCHPRHGKVKTMDEWQVIGLPQAPNLMCSLRSPDGASFCRCDLVEASRFDVPLKPVDATEALAAARKPFKRRKTAKGPYQSVNDLPTLLRMAKDELPRLLEALHDLDVPGINTIKARVKEEGAEPSARLLEKLKSREPNQISDYLGGKLYYDTPDDVQAIIDGMRAKGYQVQSIDDFLGDTGRDRGGYRAVHVQLVASNGLSFELQIIPQDIGEIKTFWHEEVFKKWRGLSSLTPEQEAEKAADFARMAAGFDAAWEKFLARSRAP